MKTLKRMSKSAIFVIMITVISPVNAQDIQIGQAFSSDTTFNPFNGEHGIYSFTMFGDINLSSDSSLVRVVLIDRNGNHFLVYEAYPLITTFNSFSVDGVCDETCYLDGIDPDSIRIDIVNAIINIDKFKYDLNQISNINDLQAQTKLLNDSIKAINMNQRIQGKDMYWHAGRTSLVGLSFQEKEREFGKKYNLSGFDYYEGGIFGFYQKQDNSGQYSSNYVDNFDWRNRHSSDKPGTPYYNPGGPGIGQHSAGWLTGTQSQGEEGLCWDYATTHTIGDYANIYLNNLPMPNYYLSADELKCLMFLYFNADPCGGALYTNAFNPVIPNYGGIHVQDPNYHVPCPPSSPCSYNGTNAKINFTTSSTISLSNEDDLKHAIITQGPLASGIYFDPSSGHAMELVGFKTIKTGDTVYSNGSGWAQNGIIYQNDYQKNVWIFKNSYLWSNSGTSTQVSTAHWIYYDDQGSLNSFGPTLALSGDVIINGSPMPPQYWDKDGDGYYWWGVGQKPTNCPGNQVDEDCDDSNKDLGPYNINNYSFPLYECTNNCPSYSVTTSLVTTSFTWSTEKHINYTLKIPANITVTINSKIWFHPNAFILVENGGTLVITQLGQLSSECNKLWKGIRVFGTGSDQGIPGAQGKVEIQGNSINHGTISDAVFAIKDTTNAFSTESGAIIIANYASFIDNKTSIYLMKFSNAVTASKLNNCKFETNDVLSDGSPPLQFVSLNNLSYTGSNKILTFNNCLFKENGIQRNIKGIVANNSDFCVNPGNSFTYLLYGIYATDYMTPNVPFKVNGNTFTNNCRGIYVSGVQSAEIISNNIDVPYVSIGGAPAQGSDPYTSYGIYLEHCCHYHIEANYIHGGYSYPSNTGVRSCGIYVKNSDPYFDNQIYRNNIYTLRSAICSFDANRDGAPGSNIGLELKCNIFSDGPSSINGTDIGVYTSYIPDNFPSNYGIKSQQGLADTQFPNLSAGNVFSPSISGHLYDIINNGNWLQYNHHHFPYSNTPKVRPDNYNYANFHIHNNSNSYYQTGVNPSCPEWPILNSSMNIQSLQSNLFLAKNKIDSLSAVLSLLTDGGNSDSLNLAILCSIPPEAWALYLDLMSKSPYLSDSVLKSAALKEDVLINALIRDIMVANPQSAKSDSIIQLLENRFIPLPDSMMAEILSGQDTLDAKEILENTRGEWYQTYGESFNQLMNIFREDTLNNGNDSIISLLQSDFRYASKYDLAFRLLDQGNIQQADQIIENIPDNYSLNSLQTQEYQKYVCFYNCVKRAVQNSASICFDSLQISSLDSLVEADTSYIFIPTVYSRNALQAAGLLTYYESLIFDEELKSTVINPGFSRHKSSLSYLKIYPNPATDYIILDYKLDPRGSNASIYISSLDGQVLYNLKLDKVLDQKVFSTTRFENGIYLITLNVNGKRIQTNKLMIIR